MEQWLAENGFSLIDIFCGGGLFFTGFSIYRDSKIRKEEVKARKVANLLLVTANHRELWKEFNNHPVELARIVDPQADLMHQPFTPAEENFMNMVISHTSSSYEAVKDELLTDQDGFQKDVKSFFSRPIPNAVWRKVKPLQNPGFVDFIESALR